MGEKQMDKESFIRQYRDKTNPKITVIFCETYFRSNSAISCNITRKLIEEFREYFTPWHQKDGILCGAIDTVLKDHSYRTIRVKEAKNYPEIEAKINSQPIPDGLTPIPIATDLKSKRTLILDSNKTIIAMLSNGTRSKEKIEVVEVVGENLGRLVPDFEVLARDN